MHIIIGPSFTHCERHALLLKGALGWKRQEDGHYRGLNGETVLFVIDPDRLKYLPRNARIYDAFAGLFHHELARHFAEVLLDFDQYFHHSVTEELSSAAA